MAVIERLTALEILDSRGNPTIKVTCTLADGTVGSASVPSGASTGRAEAHELRDGDPARYRGRGCLRAVDHVRREIQDALAGRAFADQAALDQALIALDGTPDKSRLGANATLGVSLAFARACASRARLPLYRHFAAILDREPGSLPRPFINLFSGGKHAGGQVALQDVQIVAPSARTMADALRLTAAVYQAAIERIAVRYRARPLAADEGGLAPDFPDSAAMLADTVAAIEAAGLRPGADMAIALDAAASHFYADGLYHLDGRALSTDGLIAALTGWLDAYPIVSVEDGLSEDDWDGWARWRQAAAGRALILGDDLLCTNVTRIQRAIDRGTADALLLKVNQVGTLTEAAAAFRLARAAGWRIVVSARSGETEDDWLADLAVGWGGDHIKVGAITRSERLAKYNRLLEIEAETGWPLTPLNPAGT
ncbi:MAG: phosphopyruvate hydratase [Candidatus Flexifilum sp.]